MADFLESVGTALGNRFSNRSNDILNVLNNPSQAFLNRVEGVNTATQAPPQTPADIVPDEVPKIAPLPSPSVMPQQNVAPVAGPAKPIDYNASIAQQESGGRADIGYHDKTKSTAYGPYGLTAAAYQDARKLNPELPEDITKASPEQQTAAQNAYTQQNSRYLQNYGVEVNPNTLSAAHLLGAKGLSDFQKTGYLSPQAAAANGGEENLRKIVQTRLGGQMAPASGAAQAVAPQTQTAINPETGETYQKLVSTAEATPVAGPAQPYDMGEMAGVDQAIAQQAAQPQPQISEAQQQAAMAAEMQRVKDYDDLSSGDPRRLIALTENTDKNVASFANAQLADIFKDKRLKEYAKNYTEPRLAKGEIPDIKRLKGEEGSYIKAYLFARLGLNDLAQQEQALISGTNVKFQPINLPGGEQYSVKFNAKTGEVVSAKDINNNEVTNKEKLGQIAAQAMTASQIGQAGATRVRDASGKEWSVVPTAQGSMFYDNANVRGVPTGKTVPIQGGTDIELQGQLQTQKNQGKLDLLNKELSTRLDYIPAQEHNKFISKFNAENGTNFALMTGPGGKPQVVERPAGTGGVATGAGSTTIAGQPPAPTQAISPAAVKNQQELAKKEGDAFIKFGAEDITPKADAGGQVARIRKQQINGPDGILANPELAGLLQGQGGASTEVLNILRDTITGNFKDGEELSRRVNALNLTQRQKDAVNIQIGLAKQVDPQTLKQNAGPGAVSDAEQKANRQANVDITRQGLYSGLTLMTRSQFTNDLAVARAEFKASRPDLNTTDKFNSAWNTEKARLNKEFDAIYEARAKYIGQYNKDGKNPGAVVDAYKYYPVPEYNSENKSWVYGGYSDKAKRPKLDSFVK